MIKHNPEEKWKRIDKVRCEHPDWGCFNIAKATGISHRHVTRLIKRYAENSHSKEEGRVLAQHPQINLDYIREHWREFLRSLRGEGASGNLDAFLRSATDPIGLHDGILTLGFYYSFHKDKVEMPRYRELIESRLAQMFGYPYKIECVLLNEVKRKTESASLTTAEVIREIEATLAPINEQLSQLSQIAALLKTLKGLVEDYETLHQKYLELQEQNRKHLARRVELQRLLAQPT